MLIDSHFHLAADRFLGDSRFSDIDSDYYSNDKILARAAGVGVSHALAIGTGVEDSLQNIEFCQRGDLPLAIFSAVGIHPGNSVSHIEKYGVDGSIAELEKMCDSAISIGECGLDYHEISDDKNSQKKVFEAQVDLAVRYDLPLEIHSRDAEEDTIAVLKNFQKARGVIHCFSGSEKFAKEALDIGFYISFSGIVTFKKAELIKQIAVNLVPLDRMLVETDSPFLAPVPFRGKVNEPAHVKEVCSYLAELRNVSFDDMASVTSDNFFTVFKGGIR